MPAVEAKRAVRLCLLASLACGTLAASSWQAAAQPAGLNPNRDCQTLLTCQYNSGGYYRGCLSSYTCRVCRLVTAPCSINGTGRVCQRVVCTWG